MPLSKQSLGASYVPLSAVKARSPGSDGSGKTSSSQARAVSVAAAGLVQIGVPKKLARSSSASWSSRPSRVGCEGRQHRMR